MYDHRFAGPRSLLRHMRRCHMDERTARTKVREMELYQALQQAGVQFEFQRHIPFAGCGINSETKCAYLDFLIAKPWGYISLECDEDQHKERDPSSDPRRDFDIDESVLLGSGHKLRVIRYNPDTYKVDGVTRRTPKKERLSRLLELLEADPPERFERWFLYYDHKSGAPLPEVSVFWAPDASAVSRVMN